MQKQSNKTIEEKRRQAQMALEGSARKQARKEEADRKLAEEIQKKAAEERKKMEEKKEKEMKEKEEKERVERTKKEKERQEKKEEERKKQEKERALAKKEALLKKIRPPRNISPSLFLKPTKETLEQKMQEKRQPLKKSRIPQIRTYRNDVADAVKAQGESLVKIAIKKREIKTPPRTNTPKKILHEKKSSNKIFFISAGLVFILLSGGILLYQINKSGGISKIFQSNSVNKENLQTKTKNRSLSFPYIITPGTEKEIQISTEVSLPALLYKETKATSGIDSIKNIYITDPSTALNKDASTVKPVVAKRLFSLWNNSIPSLLKRSLSDKFMVGVYSSSLGINAPFLILTTNSHDQAFAGMFAWENTLPSDFFNLFEISTKRTSLGFRDAVINGKDVRILKNTAGETILLYSFVDENTVVITIDEATFRKILSGLSR